MVITRDQFEKYLTVQARGNFNMFDQRAIDESGLSKGVYMEIIKDYTRLKDEYKDLFDKYIG